MRVLHTSLPFNGYLTKFASAFGEILLKLTEVITFHLSASSISISRPMLCAAVWRDFLPKFTLANGFPNGGKKRRASKHAEIVISFYDRFFIIFTHNSMDYRVVFRFFVRFVSKQPIICSNLIESIVNFRLTFVAHMVLFPPWISSCFLFHRRDEREKEKKLFDEQNK